MKYEDFLLKKYSIYELYQVVTNRISYKYDFGEFWNAPKTAWNQRWGDCEEFSSVCSDYLTKHKIENYIAGLNIKNSSIGHAAVFMKYQNHFYMIDLTMALEPQGVKRLENIHSLREAVLKYSTLPVPVFKIPEKDGEKEVVKVIY